MWTRSSRASRRARAWCSSPIPTIPTGTYLAFDEVKRLRAGLPEDVLLVLDAAYAEYVRANDYEAGIELVATTHNMVMTRTFSKIYGLGLAQARLGLLPGERRRCAQPHPRAVQRLGPGHRRGHRRARGSGASRAGGRT